MLPICLATPCLSVLMTNRNAHGDTLKRSEGQNKCVFRHEEHGQQEKGQGCGHLEPRHSRLLNSGVGSVKRWRGGGGLEAERAQRGEMRDRHEKASVETLSLVQTMG